jgi:hypothetical protein
MGQINLVIPGQESLAQTRSFASMYVATVALRPCWPADDLFQAMSRLPELAGSLLYEPLAQSWGSN